jgi:ribose transport system substrate-binding protein
LIDELSPGAEAGVVSFPEVSDVELRVQGTKNVVEGSEIDVVAELGGNCERAKAVNVVTDMLQANPGISGIFGECGLNATGAIQAIKNSGKVPGKDIKVVGFDGNPEELAAIQSGEELATVLQDFPGIGAACVKVGTEAAQGKSVPKEVAVPATLITQANKDEFEAEGELVVPK